MKADFDTMYFMQNFIWRLGHFVGGRVEVVGLLTFGGGGRGVVQNRESPDCRSPEVGISAQYDRQL